MIKKFDKKPVMKLPARIKEEPKITVAEPMVSVAVGGEMVPIENIKKKVSKIDTASLSLSPFAVSKPMS